MHSLIKAVLLLLILTGAIQFLLSPPEALSSNAEYIKLSEGFIAYDKSGTGDNKIILIHGSPGSRDDFENLLPSINNATLYALDMYCFGGSSKHVKDCGIDAAAETINEFMEKKSITKAGILGYSWGGGVAIEFAYKYPEKTESVIILDGMGIPEGEITGNYYTERLRYFISYPLVVYYPGAFFGDEEWRKGFMRSYLDTDLSPIREHLSKISVPALLLHGDQDTIVPLWVAEEHARLIPDSRLKLFKGGHITLFSDTAEISSIINSYFSGQNEK